MERIEKFNIPDDAILTTVDVYINMLEGKIIKVINGLDKVKQLVDYDLTELKERIWNYRSVIHDFKIDISYTGAFIYQYGMESIGKENYYIDLEGRSKEAYLEGDMDYVESVFKGLDKETKKSLVSLALKDRKGRFCKKT